MRGKTCMVAVLLMAVSCFAQERWSQREVAAETNAWRPVRVALAAENGHLVLRPTSDGNGFVFPSVAPCRHDVSAEADIRIKQRLCSSGWNFAGVALYLDDANYWMLSLVEGPDGKHTVDFIENHDGVWQAQNESKTALIREGNVSFPWKSDVTYRLRLAFRAGKVCAEVSDPADGHTLGTASYAWKSAKAVRSGRSALIVHASAAVCDAFKIGLRENPSRATRVALLDDALPGHDQAANARLAEALTQKGFGVTRLTAEQLLAPDDLTGDAFSVLIVPQCASLPAQAAEAVLRFAQEGGHLVFIGGPLLDHALWQVDGRWRDADGLASILQTVTPAHWPFVIGTGLDLKAWHRSCQDNAVVSTFRVVNEGPAQAPCLRVDIPELSGWDMRQSPELPHLFGEGDTFFSFLGKGDAKTSQLAVEIIERDGSRWIATAALTPEWRRVGLRLSDFHFWHDSVTAGKRGYAKDALKPDRAARLCLGLSASHTAAVGAGAHTFWLADVGTARDPLTAAGAAVTESAVSLETLYPRYKVYTLQGSETIRATAFGACGSRGSSSARACQGTVCAIPRTDGAGIGRHGKWRFVPLAEARGASSVNGACEWLLLNTRFPLEGVAFAGFGYNDSAVWSAPDVLERITGTVERLTKGAMFEEAGSEQFAYWPGEPVKLGARIRAFGADASDGVLTLDVRKGDRVVWSEHVKCPVNGGCSFTWQPPAEPGTYTFRANLEGHAGFTDAVQHDFAVLDPAPAPKNAFVAVRDGDFWLNGKKWYPVGMNFWPLYVSGMDKADYGAGWLCDSYYAPSLVEQDLAQLENLGVNMVSVQSPSRANYRNLLDFLRRCAQHDIRVNLYVGLASPLAFNDVELTSFLEATRLPGNPIVFAYDTIWEPGNHVFKDATARHRWDAAWRAWIDERYGSLVRAERDWGVNVRRDKDGNAVSPADGQFREDGPWRGMMAAYRRFMDDLTSSLWGKANRRLRELDPNHLISFRQGNTLPYDFALSGPVKHIDFICPEGYSIRDTDEGEDGIGFITRYVQHTTGGKPIIWSEFGRSVWDSMRMAPDPEAVIRQGHYEERFYRTALAAGAAGTVPWWWVGGYRVDERSDFGVVEPDRTERPAAQLIRTYGPRFKTPRIKPEAEVPFVYDRDVHAGGYWWTAFHDGAAAYREAVRQGRMLDVRTQGTGKNSENMPWVAVGNVPCNGSNPPKYLDAEFNYLQVLDADGVWREAEDGVELATAGGHPVRVRASVGNLQEATWLAPSGVMLVVRRGDGAMVGSVPIKAHVPYLSDADFGGFDVVPNVDAKTVLSVRLEAVSHNGRVPFGEARVFTVFTVGR